MDSKLDRDLKIIAAVCNEGLSIRKAAEKFGVSKTTVERVLKSPGRIREQTAKTARVQNPKAKISINEHSATIIPLSPIQKLAGSWIAALTNITEVLQDPEWVRNNPEATIRLMEAIEQRFNRMSAVLRSRTDIKPDNTPVL